MIAGSLRCFLFGLGLLVSPSLLATSPLNTFKNFVNDPKTFLIENPRLLKGQIQSTLSRRCQAYTHEVRQCDFFTTQFIKFLELAPVDLTDGNQNKVKYIVSFADKLNELSIDQRTLPFLNTLIQKLILLQRDIVGFRFISPELIRSIDLGEVIRPYFGDDSLRVLAVLFQDLPESEVQVQYLAAKLGPSDLVDKLHEAIMLLKNISISGKFPITVFGVRLYNQRLYHFLVPAYLSQALKASGAKDSVSFILPFLFNFLYEAGDAAGNFRTFFIEPVSLENTETQDDIRAGELGSWMGIGRPAEALDETTARAWLKVSPISYISNLARKLRQ